METLTNRELIEQKSNMILHMKAMEGKYVLGVQVMSLDMLWNEADSNKLICEVEKFSKNRQELFFAKWFYMPVR